MKKVVYLLAGPRGSGKTVFLSSVIDYFKTQHDWIVADLNSLLDLQEQLAAILYQKGKMKHYFLDKEFSFSFHGLTFSLSSKNPAPNITVLLNEMLDYLTKKGVSVLISIDEVTNNEYMGVFSLSYQSFYRNRYRVSLVMTGLYENFSKLENNESLTFLFRTPKIFMNPLNLRAIAYSYIDTLNMKEIDAIEVAKITKGYAFAYQLLGYILFQKGKKHVDEEVLHQLDIYLEERSYSKIYSELTKKEKQILTSIANGTKTNQKIMKMLDMKSNSLSSYKIALTKKGLIQNVDRGVVDFALPRFKEFILFKSLI